MKRFYFLITVVVLINLLSVQSSFGQNGPAGVGNFDGSSGEKQNIIWLDAGDLSSLSNGDAVTTWTDKTTNNNDLIQLGADPVPFFRNDGLASGAYPVVRFDGTERYLQLLDNAGLDESLDGISILGVVYNNNLSGATGIVSKRNAAGNQDSYSIFTWTNNRFIFDVNTGSGNNRLNSSNDVVNVTDDFVFSAVYDGSLQRSFLQTDELASTTLTGNISNTTSDLIIGALNENYGTYFDGDIAELIIYRGGLNDAERLIVENYLAEKYNLAITNDIFGQYVNFDPNYFNDLRAIGTSDGTVKKSISGFSDALQLRERNGGLNTNLEFFAIGHNDAVAHADGVTADIGANITSRWQKDFYLENSQNNIIDNGESDMDLIFDFGDAGLTMGSPANYVLLFRSSTSGNYERVFASDYSSENGDQLVISVPGNRIKSGYYTVGIGAQLISKTWYVLKNGDWSDPNTWTLDAGIAPAPNNPGNDIPGEEDNIIIRNGKTVNVQTGTNDLEIASLRVDGKIDLNNTTGHDFKVINGKGTIEMQGNAGVSNFPLGSTTGSNGFANELNGGLLVVSGTGLEFDQNLTLKDLRIDLTNPTDEVVLGADLTLNGDFTIRKGTWEFGDNTPASREFTVFGDALIQNNGSTQDGRITTSTQNVRHNFNLYGDFTNEGDARFSQRTTQTVGSDPTDGITDFHLLSTDRNQEISANGPTYFLRVIIDKGDPAYSATFTASQASNFVLTGRANDNTGGDIDDPTDNENAFGLITGTAVLGTNINVNPLNNTGNYSIGTNAKLLIDGGFARKTGGDAITPYGEIEINAGTLQVESSSGITSRGTGLLKVNGGTVNIPQFRTSVNGPENVGGLEINGGQVNIGQTNGVSPSNNYYTLSLTYTENAFIMTGGELNVSDASNRGLVFINSAPGNVNVSGGQVNLYRTNNNLAKITSKAPFYNLSLDNSNNSTNANAKFAVVTGSSGNGGEERTITDPNLYVLNNLILETGTTRTSGGNTYGSYIDFCDGGNCNDLFVGGDLRIEDSAVLDIWSGNADNAGSSTVTFNSNNDAVLYIGDITTYDEAFVGYTDPESVVTFGVWEHPFYNLIIDKPNAVLSLQAKDPGVTGNTTDIKTTSGGKNVESWRTNIFKVVNEFSLENGTLDQMDNRNISYTDSFGTFNIGYSMRLYVNDVSLNGTLFTYEDGVSPKNANVRFRINAGTVNLSGTEGSEIGNVRINLAGTSGGDTLKLNSDIYIKRMEYRHGKVNLQNNNLKIDILDFNLANVEVNTASGGRPVFDNNNLFLVSGNPSARGLSLKWPRNVNTNYPEYDNDNSGYNQEQILWFPLGPGYPDGSENSKMNMGTTYFHEDATTFADEGYITMKMINQPTQLVNQGETSGDLLDIYWEVDYEGFENTLPTVSQLFQYQDSQVAGTEGNYVPGSILNSNPYTRSSQDASNIKTGGSGGNNGQLLGTDPRNVIVFTDSNNGIGAGRFIENDGSLNWTDFPGNGFQLQGAYYTAGIQNYFVGAPTVYYSNRNATRNWNDNNSWYDAPTGTTNPPDFPEAGDIAIIRGDNFSDAIRVNGNQEAAEVIFQREGTYSDVEDIPRLWLEPTDELTVGKISGAGELYLRNNLSNFPVVNADIGEYAANDTSVVIFYMTQNGTYNIDETDFFTEFPTLRIYGQLANYNRIVSFDYDFKAKNLNVDGQSILRIGGNYTVEKRTRLGYTGGGRIEFPNGSEAFKLKTGEFVTGRAKGGSDNDYRITVNTGGGNGVEHIFEVENNIDLNFADAFDEGTATFDLFSNFSDNNAILKLSGTGNYSFLDNYSAGNSDIELYKIQMDKESLSDSFTFGDGFDIPDATSTFQPIEILNGTLIMNTPDINGGTGVTLANESNFLLPNTNNPEASSGSGSLELRDGNFLIEGDDTGLILDGLLTISGGTLDMASGAGNGNNFIEYSVSGNAEIDITDGVLDVGSQVRRGLLSTSGVLKYNQSGGVARFGINSAPEQNRGVFEVLNTGSEFNHTAGDFIVVRQNGSTTTASLRLEPDSYNFTGSTLTIGDGSTPAGQSQIGINATVPLNNLLITGNNNLNARTFINPLTVNNLEVENNGRFSANGLDLTINQDFTVDGTFNNQGDGINQQTTFFNTSSSQTILGTGNISFWNVDVTGNGMVSFEHNATIENNLNILDGILNTNAIALNLEGDLIHDGEHQSTVAGPGIVFNGGATQNIARSVNGQSTFGTITIDNGNGVEVTAGQNDFEINHKVILVSGVFDIGSNLLIMDEDALFENGSGGTSVSDFNVNNMITVNTSLIDKGVRKIYPDNFSGSFLYPVGLLNYTPAVVNATDIDGNGFITIKPIDNFSDGITDDDDELCAGATDYDDTQNVLQYYWLVKSQSVTNFNGSFLMYHNDDLESINNSEGLDLNNYAPARLLNADDTWDKNYTSQLFDEVANTITFQSDLTNNYTGLTSETIEGRYTAGITRDDSDALLCGSAIPNVVPLFETLTGIADGNVDNGGSYDGGAAPSVGQSPDLVVRGNYTLVLNDNFRRFRKVTIEENATLEINGTFGHNLGTIEGNGTLKLVDDASFPAGDYEDFFPDSNCSDGGGLEYENNDTGNDITILAEGFTNLQRLVLSGNGKKVMSNNTSVNICENLELTGGDFEMANNSELRVKGDVIKNGGSGFNAEFTNATIVMDGNTNQFISGAFTGLEAFNILEVDKSGGSLSVIDGGNNDVEISGEIKFINGLINTNTDNSLILQNSATLSGYKTSSHVNGPLIRNLNASTASQFDPFPVGQGGRYGLIEVSYIQTTDDWTATFFDESPEENTDIGTLNSNLAGPNPVVSANQYWDLTSASSNMANVKIYWDVSSNIADGSASVSESLNELRVVRFKPGSSGEWEDQGASSVSGNQNNGQLTSNTRFDFSTNYITFGAGDADNNSLPVELVFFTAENNGNRIDLKWQTASEFDNDFFEIQRSFDGKTFELIGIVEGNGTVNHSVDYLYQDFSPLAGESYYRLRQVDFNGDFEYSPVVKVNRKETSNLALVPNPTTDQAIYLKLSGFHGEQLVQVKIFDLQGRLYYSNSHKPADLGQKALPVSETMHAGIYMVEVVQGNTVKQMRLAIR
ncbi:T9SS type A sorting domain-containing protein [Marivirga sp. S37H4]|uniref:T9SS type A sorting domain-containing protein n=1 Tax=Marivirga aurantiaca TaxID=2802615 RepID=A0A934WVN5_9BACT|nr:LamG-like jellyroll fold domain-containing protein [Marivirga aurantiaca]MBK6263894.1 T9SS type A sorting domain-containing protein [Marivirga aurantiaca]